MVDEQLLEDLRHYGLDSDDLSIDWSEAVHEGHCTQFFGDRLEESSDLTVLDRDGNPVAKGWMDFIHGGTNDDPLFAFWLYLYLIQGNSHIQVKKEPTIPAHVWERLPEKTKELCTKEGQYDSRWSADPLVRLWKRLNNR